MQFIILVSSIVILIYAASTITPGGFNGILSNAADAQLFKPIYPFDPSFFSFDPHIRISFWSGIIGVTVAFCARYGADQVVVQRYFTAKSLKDAQRGYWLNATAAFFSLGLLALLGLAIHAYATHTTPHLISKLPPLKHLGNLIAALPAGTCGLIVAGLMAATMSSVDSGLNACTAAWETDFHRTLISNEAIDQRKRVIVSAILGIITTAVALAFIQLLGTHKSIFVMINKLINGLGSPLLALIICGMIPRFFNTKGVLIGGILGIVASIYISMFLKGYSLHYYALFNLVITIVPCLVFSLLFQTRTSTD